MDLKKVKEVARKAGEIALQHQSQAVSEEKNAPGSTDAEMQEKVAFSYVDKLVQDVITSEFPDSFVIAEEAESPVTDWPDGRVLVVDPIDGTRNYLGEGTGKTYWSVSLCVFEERKAEFAVMYFPGLDVMLHATKGEGAFLNDKQIRVHLPKTKTVRFNNGIRELNPELLEKFPDQGNLRAFTADFLCLVNGCVRANLPIPAYRAHICSRFYVWDLAGAPLIWQECGGLVIGRDGDPAQPFESWKYDPKRKAIMVHDFFIMTTPDQKDEILAQLNS